MNLLFRSLLILTTCLFSFTHIHAQFSRNGQRSGIPFRNGFKNLAVGESHSLQIRKGTLWAWGSNAYGQLGTGNNTSQTSPVQVGAESNWVSVTAGYNHGMAIKMDGTLWAWGYNGDGRLGIGNTVNQNSPVQVGTGNNWLSVAAGNAHVLAIKTDGTLWAWGYNAYGQLGINSTTNQSTPMQVGTDNNWVYIACGNYHSIAIKSDGTLWEWGVNGSGQLGQGNLTNQTIPKQVGTDNKWVSAVGGSSHTLGLKCDGTLWSWGDNSYGQLGNGNYINTTTPAQVGTENKWTQISAGIYQCYALKAGGSLWSWGSNSSGALGNNGVSDSPTPIQIGTSSRWMNVVAGFTHIMAWREDGMVCSWGTNSNGQLGLGHNTTLKVPTSLAVDSKWHFIQTNSNHSLGLNTDGTLMIWGSNGAGQLGYGTNMTQNTPGVVDNNKWATAWTGEIHTLAIRTDGTLWAWGNNAGGQLGIGNNVSDQPLPVQVGTDNTWVSVSANNYQSFGIKANGTLWSWGQNTYGTLGIGNLVNQFTPVQVGTDNKWVSVAAGVIHTLAIKSDGTLWAWGNNGNGQVGNGTTQNSISTPIQIGTDKNWTAVAAGRAHSFALKADGTIWAWGNNLYGQLGAGSPTPAYSPVQIGTDKNWTSISTSFHHNTAVKSNGSLWVWGVNLTGQVGNGTTTDQLSPQQVSSASKWIQAQAGTEHSLALNANRDEICYTGRNNFGQLGNGTFTIQYTWGCGLSAPTCPTPTGGTISTSNNPVCLGSNVSFNAGGYSLGTDYSYQWQSSTDNFTSNVVDVVGQTNPASCTINAISTSTSFRLKVFCTLGSSTAFSNAILTTVQQPPTFTMQPQSQSACAGTNVTLNASATNVSSFQWYKDGAPITGATNSSLTLSNISSAEAGAYTVMANGITPCQGITSNVANVSIITAATISISSATTTLCQGAPATFTAQVQNAGTNPVYQWFVNGSSAGTNSATFTTNALTNGATVSCTLQANGCAAVNSNSITASVVNPPAITTHPSSQAVCTGNNASFSIVATNAISYQWQKDGVNIPGANTNTLNLNSVNAASAGNYTVIISGNAACSAVTSNAANLAVLPLPTINIVASANNICMGSPVTFTAQTQYTGANTQYQWLVNGAPAGTNNYQFTTSTLSNGAIVSCSLQTNGCAAINSNAISINVQMPISITAQPQSQTVCAGGNVLFAISANNGSSFQWQKNGVAIPGATSPSLIINGVTAADAGNYSVFMNGISPCNSMISANASLTVVPSPTISISTATPAICQGGTASFNAQVQNAGSNPQYQWLINGVATGSTGSTYSASSLSNGSTISCTLQANGCAAATSNLITIAVNPPPSITTQPVSQTICTGNNTAFTVAAINGSSYQWQKDGMNIPGANSNTLNLNSINAASAGNYTVLVSGGAGCSAISSNVAVLTVLPSPTITITASATSICQGSTVNFTAQTQNTGSSPQYQWLVNGAPAGNNSNAFTTSSLSNGAAVSCTVQANGCAAVTSTPIIINVSAPVTITAQPSPQTVCTGNTVSLSVTAINGAGYQWQKDGVDIPGANTATLNLSNVNGSQAGNYTVVITGNAPCASVISNAAALTVLPTPVINIAASAQTICQGATVNFTATIQNGGSSPQYQWLVNGNPTGNNSSTFSSSSLANGDVVTCSLQAGSCAVVNSNAVTMTVNTPSAFNIAISSNASTICPGDLVNFTASSTTASISYQWLLNGQPVGSNTGSFASNQLSNGTQVQVIGNSTTYCLANTSAASNIITISVHPVNPPDLGPDRGICTGGSLTLNAGNYQSYTWSTGASTSSINITAPGTYWVNTVTPQGCSARDTVIIFSFPAPTVNLGNSGPICQNTTRSIDAGTFNSYAWSTGQTTRTITVNAPGTYTVTVTDNNGCTGSGSITITQLLPLPANFLGADTAICSNGTLTLKSQANFINYLWSNNSTASSINISAPGIYWLNATDNNGCTGRDSLLVKSKLCNRGLFTPNAFTPNGDGKNDVFKPMLFGNIKQFELRVFNRWGNLVFFSKDPSKGWDGTINGIKQNSGVFIWSCLYQLDNEAVKTERGSFTLIR